MVNKDYASVSYYVWVNESDHTVSLSVADYIFYNPENPPYGKSGFVATLAPGESHTEKEVAKALIPPVFDNMTVVFDGNGDSRRVEFGLRYEGNKVPPKVYLPEGYDGKYNPLDERNYDYESVKSPDGCDECGGGRWTYVFTNADYEAAVEYYGNE